MSSGSTIESTGNRRGSPKRSFSSLSSQDRTPPASTSEPVPAVVVTQTSGSGSLGIGRPSAVPPFTKSQMSPGHSLPSASVCGLAATAQMPLLPSMTEPPPSARTKSQPWVRAIQPPALTVSRSGLGSIRSNSSCATPARSSSASTRCRYPKRLTELPQVVTMSALVPGSVCAPSSPNLPAPNNTLVGAKNE